MADELDPAAAPAAPAEPVASTTIVAPPADPASPPAPATESAPPSDPAANWRDKLAGGDAEFRKRLERFADEGQFAKSYRSLEQKLSSGEYKRQLPEGASDEEKATWRKEHGIPEKPEGYLEKLSLPDGLVIGEADKPIVAEFAAAALDGDVNPAQLSKMVAKYYEIQDAQKALQEDNDAKFKQESEDVLRSEWQGAEYRQNLTAVNNLIATWPGGLATELLAARSPEGKKLGDNPVLIKQLAQLARELNPAATLVPAGTSDAGKGVTDRLNELKTLMGDSRSEYWRGPKSEALQEEYRQLLDADAKLKARAA